MKALISSFILINLLFGFSFNDFDQFEQAEKLDKQNFNAIKKEALKCIKSWDFKCAKYKISKLKKYISTKKDMVQIKNLKEKLAEEKIKQYKATNKNKDILIKNCNYASWNRHTTCSLFINGKYEGTIWYYPNDDLYNIQISSNSVTANAGYYNPKLHYTHTVNCGDSTTFKTRGITQSLYQYANCYINGNY